MTNKEIEARLEELEQMETQIRFATSKLSADDHVRLARIKEERKELIDINKSLRRYSNKGS